jgi:hypothetical protein
VAAPARHRASIGAQGPDRAAGGGWADQQRGRRRLGDRQAHGRQMAQPLCRGAPRRPARRAAAGGAPADRRRRDRRDDPHDAGEPAGGGDALEPALHGPSDGLCTFDHPPDLAGVRAAAAPAGNLQAVERPDVRREGARHRRPLSRSAGPGAGAVPRREASLAPRVLLGIAVHVGERQHGDRRQGRESGRHGRRPTLRR